MLNYLSSFKNISMRSTSLIPGTVSKDFVYTRRLKKLRNFKVPVLKLTLLSRLVLMPLELALLKEASLVKSTTN